jgi:hypothetical protein
MMMRIVYNKQQPHHIPIFTPCPMKKEQEKEKRRRN